jgi:hypothetical protein
MRATIPADSFAIDFDGARAWWLVDYPDMIDPNLFDMSDVANFDRPCKQCSGVGHLSPATYATPQNYGRACPDCDGIGWFTFEIEVEPRSRIGAQCVSVTHPTYRVHVVQVLPIVRPGEGAGNPAIDCVALPRSRNASVLHIVGEKPVDINLPPNRAAGQLVLELAVHA